MGDGFQFIDIVFFAMIAAFLVLRLRSALGRRDGTKTGHRDPFARESPEENAKTNGAGRREGTVVRLPGRDDGDEAAESAASEWAATGERKAGADRTRGLGAIAAADPSFDADEFLQGAKIAFEMILGAYVEGNRGALKPLLSREVFANFTAAMDARVAAHEQLEQNLVGIKSCEIVDAFLEGRIANITVKFVSEQINAVKDAEGRVVDGDPAAAVEVTDVWTFARDTGARDPNWTLVGTQSPD